MQHAKRAIGIPPIMRLIRKTRDFLRIDSLAFQRIEDLKKAIGLQNVCTYCWTGEDPSMARSCARGCSHCAEPCSSRIDD